MNSPSDAIVGIDLGTTNSLVAICDEGGPRVLVDVDDGAGVDSDSTVAGGSSPLVPSVVLYRSDGPPIVGSAARQARLVHPREAIWSVKRLMGRSLHDVAGEVADLPYAVVAGPRGMACVAPLGQPITPQEVSAEILRRLRQRAERALGRPVNRAVVTVPAYFDDAQRQATRDAGRLAGLDVVRIVNEPTAAALAYGIGVRGGEPPARRSKDTAHRAQADWSSAAGDASASNPAALRADSAAPRDSGSQTIAVYDLGGGTFDVSILRVEPGIGSDPGDGGKRDGHGDHDHHDHHDPPGPHAPPDPDGPEDGVQRDDGVERRRTAASDAGGGFFQVLSTAGDTRLGGDDLDTLLADELERRLASGSSGGGGAAGVRAPLGERDESSAAAIPANFEPGTTSPAGEASSASKDLDIVKLRRRSSRRERLRAAAEAAKIALSTDERTIVRLGESAAEGDQSVELPIERTAIELLAMPLVERTLACCRRALADARLAAADIDRVVLVGGMTRMPLVRRAVAEFFGRTPYMAFDPDQVVALGAAVQGSIIAGHDRQTLLLDVIPLSLGIETVGGAVAKLVVRNTSVPARAREMFSTSVDGQTSVKIHVLQGERELVADCRSLGEFHLRGIPPMPAGIPQIEVEFLVDANGILDVTALERRSGKRAAIQVVPAHGLTRDEVDRMERESFTHARTDMHVHRVIDLVVNAQLDMKWIGEALGRVRGELDPTYAASIDARLDELARLASVARADPARADAEALHRAKQELDVASVRVHEVSIARSLRG